MNTLEQKIESVVAERTKAIQAELNTVKDFLGMKGISVNHKQQSVRKVRAKNMSTDIRDQILAEIAEDLLQPKMIASKFGVTPEQVSSLKTRYRNQTV